MLPRKWFAIIKKLIKMLVYCCPSRELFYVILFSLFIRPGCSYGCQNQFTTWAFHSTMFRLPFLKFRGQHGKKMRILPWTGSLGDRVGVHFRVGHHSGSRHCVTIPSHAQSCCASKEYKCCRRANRSRERCPLTLPQKRKSSDSCHEQSSSAKKECLKGTVDHMEVWLLRMARL